MLHSPLPILKAQALGPSRTESRRNGGIARGADLQPLPGTRLWGRGATVREREVYLKVYGALLLFLFLQEQIKASSKA